MMVLLVLAGCKDKRTVVAPPVQEVQRPTWVASRPVSDAYYIGIGLAARSGQGYQETAKKNALNDLASEISVRVEGNSLLSTLDRRTSFSESYTSNIRTSTSERLEGFELVDTWDNGTEYWTYYRLSKAEHARIKAERKRKAIEQATDLYARSNAALQAGDLKTAMEQDLRALLAIKEYWGESDQVDLGNGSVVLANELYNDLQRQMAGVRIAVLPERCALDHANAFKRELLISAYFDGPRGHTDLAQLPLLIEYPGIGGKVTERRSTDAEARARTVVQRVALEGATPEIIILLDMSAMTASDLDQAFVGPLTAGLSVPEKRVPLDITFPRVHLQAIERNFGQPVAEGGAALVLKEELSRKGFRFVERASDADILMLLNADTREGGSSNGFFTAYLDVSFNFRDRRSGETIYEGGRQGVKGVQLNYDKAGYEAYKKAGQELRKDLVPKMLDAIL